MKNYAIKRKINDKRKVNWIDIYLNNSWIFEIKSILMPIQSENWTRDIIFHYCVIE